MSTEIPYRGARANFASILNRVTDDQEIIVFRRPGKEPVALVAVDELERLLETAYLFRSPANARRLQTAIDRALTDSTPSTNFGVTCQTES
jgi:antitoxin YefM